MVGLIVGVTDGFSVGVTDGVSVGVNVGMSVGVNSTKPSFSVLNNQLQ